MIWFVESLNHSAGISPVIMNESFTYTYYNKTR